MSKRKIAVLVLLAVGIGATISLVVGSLVTYAPSVDRDVVQNDYIQHIFQHAAAIAAILVGCLILELTEQKPPKE